MNPAERGFFPGFSERLVATPQGPVRVRLGGSGCPVLLLHGHPRTHTTWHRVAPALARDFTVVCADLPGFGKSYPPRTIQDSSGRAKARVLRSCMEALGFGVAGHDRGAYRAFRLAMDFPQSVAALMVMDAVPIVEALERTDWRFARDWWHWFFFAQSDKAQAAIMANPDLWYPPDPAQMGPENAADFLAATRDPAVVRRMLADYRAGLEHDHADDAADRQAGRRLQCPLGLLWSARDDMERLYGDPAEPWADWAPHVAMKQRVESGHHMAEEAPDDVARHLAAFFSGCGGSPRPAGFS